jgi:sugar-specific transcriptional regulator TrmB
LKDVDRLNEKWMEKALINLGFTEIDANVYIHLTKEGPKKISEIANALEMYRKRLHHVLKKLQSKGVIRSSQECPDTFLAVSFDKVLDIYIKANIEEAKTLMQNKEDLLSSWRSITEKDKEKS